MLNMKKHLLSVQELAEYLNVKPITIYRLVKAGKLPAKQIGDGIRFMPDDVEKFLAGAKFTKSKRGRKSKGEKIKKKKGTKHMKPKPRRRK